MNKIHKEILRYVILVATIWFSMDVTYEMLEYAFDGKEEMSNQVSAVLIAIQTSVLGTWGYIMKKFFETKAES